MVFRRGNQLINVDENFDRKTRVAISGLILNKNDQTVTRSIAFNHLLQDDSRSIDNFEYVRMYDVHDFEKLRAAITKITHHP